MQMNDAPTSASVAPESNYQNQVTFAETAQPQPEQQTYAVNDPEAKAAKEIESNQRQIEEIQALLSMN